MNHENEEPTLIWSPISHPVLQDEYVGFEKGTNIFINIHLFRQGNSHQESAITCRLADYNLVDYNFWPSFRCWN